MGYFGIRDEIRYWAVTCKRCGESINFAHFDERGHLYDHVRCVVAVQCPRCRDRRRYLASEIWRHRVTETPSSVNNGFVTAPIFIQFLGPI